MCWQSLTGKQQSWLATALSLQFCRFLLRLAIISFSQPSFFIFLFCSPSIINSSSNQHFQHFFPLGP